MLLIDGVKFQEWKPQKEVEEFHPLVREHFKEIFGDNSIIIDGNILKSDAGTGSKPDWFVITFGDAPQWHIVEAELSAHPLYDHIVNQVGRFINGIKNSNTQKRVIDSLYNALVQNRVLKAELEEAIKPSETYKFLSDLISRLPVLTIISEEKTPELEEALDLLRYSPIKTVEFKTFRRVGAEAVHAHVFVPLIFTSSIPTVIPYNPPQIKKKFSFEDGTLARPVTLREVIDIGLLQDGQYLYFYDTKMFKDEKAQIVASQNKLKYEEDNNFYSPSALAAKLVVKHGFTQKSNPSEVSVAGPKYWVTEDGKFLSELQDQIRLQRGDRK